MIYSTTEDKAKDYLRKAGLTGDQVQLLAMTGYFNAPASRRNHLAFKGGLALHSIHVTDQLLALGAFANERSAYRVGMLHDLVKAWNYDWNGESLEWTKRASCYPGHGTASVLNAQDLGIELAQEERQAIVWHMGAFAIRDRETNDAYDQAKLLFPRQIVLTHAADHLASAMEDYEEAHAAR